MHKKLLLLFLTFTATTLNCMEKVAQRRNDGSDDIRRFTNDQYKAQFYGGIWFVTSTQSNAKHTKLIVNSSEYFQWKEEWTRGKELDPNTMVSTFKEGRRKSNALARLAAMQQQPTGVQHLPFALPQQQSPTLKQAAATKKESTAPDPKTNWSTAQHEAYDRALDALAKQTNGTEPTQSAVTKTKRKLTAAGVTATPTMIKADCKALL